MNLKSIFIFTIPILLLVACNGKSENDNIIFPSSLLNVPSDYSSIQKAIDTSIAGDTIFIDSGVYKESIVINNKSDIKIIGIGKYKTIIDGSESFGFSIYDSDNISISKISITNADDGVTSNSNIHIKEVSIYKTIDGIDMEGGSLTVENSAFTDNKDDAIDLDESTSAIINNNMITRSGDDGIEIRLHPHPLSLTPLSILITHNIITHSKGDGIQLIDYEVNTNRYIKIQRNLFISNEFSGIGVNDNKITIPNLIPGELEEKVNISNNTFAYGQTGIVAIGNKLAAFNNLFFDNSNSAYITSEETSFSHSVVNSQVTTVISDSIIEKAILLTPCFLPTAFSIEVLDKGVKGVKNNNEFFEANTSGVTDELIDYGFSEFNDKISCM
jgi:hypothetical protein